MGKLDGLERRLLAAVGALARAGWPPVFVYVFDEAWEVLMRLWDAAEAVLGGECLLEESLAAFQLRAKEGEAVVQNSKDARGRRHVGTNFGIPHRDYTYADAHFADGSLKLLSVWVPLNDATLQNGCMYVVPKEFDSRWDRDGTHEHKFAMTDGLFGNNTFLHFPIDGLRPLPAKAGSFLAWGGSAIHWGSSCHRACADDPRTSIAVVFRRADAVTNPEKMLPPKAKLQALPIPKRLEIIAGAMAYFKHWYKVPPRMLEVLGKLECLQSLKAPIK